MSLLDRINDRREATDKIVPMVERRGGDERRVPRWITWTRENEKAGAKDMTGRIAA
jgi:hypothetical protein